MRRGRGVRRYEPGVTLVEVGHLDCMAGDTLDHMSQGRHLVVLQRTGGRHQRGEQMAQRVDGAWSLAPFCRLYQSSPARAPLSGVDCSVWLSRTTALGLGTRSGHAHERAEIVDRGLNDAGREAKGLSQRWVC